MDSSSTSCTLQAFLEGVLSWELSRLAPEDVRSRGYFHGRLSRLEAEALLPPGEEGHFLVRESRSWAGRQYVLSCRSSALAATSAPGALHFLIHQSPEAGEAGEASEERGQYAFDGDQFHSIGALISFHLQTQTPVTSTSGAIISKPVQRTRPLNLRRLEKCKCAPQTLTLTKT